MLKEHKQNEKRCVPLTSVSAPGEPRAVSVLPELRERRLGQDRCSRLNPLSKAIIVYFSCSPQQILFNWQEGSIAKSSGFKAKDCKHCLATSLRSSKQRQQNIIKPKRGKMFGFYSINSHQPFLHNRFRGKEGKDNEAVNVCLATQEKIISVSSQWEPQHWFSPTNIVFLMFHKTTRKNRRKISSCGSESSNSTFRPVSCARALAGYLREMRQFYDNRPEIVWRQLALMRRPCRTRRLPERTRHRRVLFCGKYGRNKQFEYSLTVNTVITEKSKGRD